MRDEISSALFDMLDIKKSLSKRIKNKLKDGEGTETTIGDCIDSVIETLERLEATIGLNILLANIRERGTIGKEKHNEDART